MSETMRPVVLSVRTITGIEPIDGGDTLAVRFEAPDGREIALLVPRNAVSELKDLLTKAHEASVTRGSPSRQESLPLKGL